MIFPQWLEPQQNEQIVQQSRDVDFVAVSSLGQVTVKVLDEQISEAFDKILKKLAKESKYKSILNSIIFDKNSTMKFDVDTTDVSDKSPKYIDDYINNPEFSISTVVPPSDTVVHWDSETSLNKAKSEQQHNFNNAVQSLLKKVKDESLLNFDTQEELSATLLVDYKKTSYQNQYEVIADTKNGIYPDGFVAVAHICEHYNISPVNISSIKVEKHIHSDAVRITLNGFAEQYLKWDC